MTVPRTGLESGACRREPTRVSPDQVRLVVETNLIGPMRMINAMLPLLRRSAAPRIVNMSSGVGSLARQSATTGELTTGPISGASSPSKTFLNAVTLQYAKELRDTEILINLACPGFVATDLNGFRGVRNPRAGRRDRDAARDPARRRTHRWLLRGRRDHPLVRLAEPFEPYGDGPEPVLQSSVCETSS